MKFIGRIVPVFLITILISCSGWVSSPRSYPTVAMETAMAGVQISIVETQTVLPSNTHAVPSETEDISFWENVDSIPSNVSVTEYALPPQVNPTESEGLTHLVPMPVWSYQKAEASPTPRITTIEELGYEVRQLRNAEGVNQCRQLYRDDRLLFDCDVQVSKVYTIATDTGSITAFIVKVDLGRENFLIENDAINAWGEYSIYDSAPILYQGELLWARTFSYRIEVIKSNGEVVFTLKTAWLSNHHTIFKAWNGHWILEANGSVVQDGEMFGQKFDFQEIFNWGLVKDKPTYFFRKGSEFGLSHAGNFFWINYQNVAHGLCCGPAQNNPLIWNDAVRFFGERDGVWYYVVMEFN